MNWPSDYHLVLLPGLDGTGFLFEPLLEVFPSPKHLSIVRYPANRILDYEQLTQHALSQIPDSKKIVLLAESFSGPIAVRLLENIQPLALIYCTSFLRTPRPLLLRALAILPLASLVKLPCPKFVLKYFCLGQECPNATVALFRKAIKEVSPKILAYRLRLLSNFNDLKKIKSFPKPILYLQASNDRLLPKSCLIEFEKHSINLTVRNLEGSHLLLQSSPETAAKAICEFCSKLESKQSATPI